MAQTLYKIRLSALTSHDDEEIWADSELEAITKWIKENARYFSSGKQAMLRVERSRMIEVTNVEIPTPTYDLEIVR